MSSNSQPAFKVHSDSTKNRSIPELISFLRSAFRYPDFEEVAQILVKREEKIKEELSAEIENMKKDYEMIVQKHGDLALEKLLIENEVKDYQRECDVLKEQITRLGEDKRVICDRERRLEERYSKLLEDVKKQEERDKKKLVELQSRNRELECGKRKAEAEIEVWKRRFGELESRVLRLEEDAVVLMSRKSGEVGVANMGSNEGMGEKRRSEASEFHSEKDVGSGRARLGCHRIEENGSIRNGLAAGCSTGYPKTEGSGGLQTEGMVHVVQVKESCPSDSERKYEKHVKQKLVFEAVSPTNKMVSSMPSGGSHVSGGFCIEINDSDDEMPTGKNCLLSSKNKRKRESCINISESDNDGYSDDVAYKPSNGECKMKQREELIDEPRGFPGDYYSTAPASAGGNNVDKFVTPSRHNLVGLRPCKEKTGAEQNSPYFFIRSFVNGSDGHDSEDGSTDSTTDSEDDANINELLSKLGKNRY